MKKLLPLFILILSVGAFGQDSCPDVMNGSTGITKITNINSDLSKDFTCRKRSFSGTITGLHFDSDESAELSGITIQLADGRREQIWINDDEFLDCLSEADKGNWRSQIRKGARVKVSAWACGAGGKSDLSMESIEFLVSKRKRK